MAIDKSKLTKLAALEALAQRAKAEISKTDAKVEALDKRVDELVTAGGEPNVITAVKVNGEALTITDKAVDVTVPTKVSDLANDSKFQTDEQVAAAVASADHLKRKIVANTGAIDLTADDAAQYIYMVLKSSAKSGDKYDEYMVIDGAVERVGDWTVDLSGYVEKEAGSGLYPDADKAKLGGVSEGANKVTATAGSGTLTIDGQDVELFSTATDAEVTEMLDSVFSAAE